MSPTSRVDLELGCGRFCAARSLDLSCERAFSGLTEGANVSSGTTSVPVIE